MLIIEETIRETIQSLYRNAVFMSYWFNHNYHLASMQGADQHIRSRILPEGASTRRPGESNQHNNLLILQVQQVAIVENIDRLQQDHVSDRNLCPQTKVSTLTISCPLADCTVLLFIGETLTRMT